MNTDKEEQIPLVVDLDGTLLKTELPWESFISVLSYRPFLLIKIILKRTIQFKKHFLKMKLEQTAQPFLKEVPLSKNFLQYLKTEKLKGRILILCTGSTQSYAEKIQQLIPIFTSVWGSTFQKNLVGKNKAQFLIEKYGEKKFDYAGNSFVDLYVAPFARRFILVNPSAWLLLRTKNISIYKIFKEKKITFKELISCTGLFLWLINGLIYTVVFFIKPTNNTLSSFLISFLSLNCLSSSFYILFLMSRIFSDRKSNRQNNAFADGNFSLQTGVLSSSLFLIGFLILSLVIFLKNVNNEGLLHGTVLIAIKLLISALYIFGIYKWVYNSNHRYRIPVLLSGIILITVPVFYTFL